MSSTGKHTQPVSGFSPLNFGGCRLWLDATSSSNFALTGTNITTWYDKSPFSNHASNVAGGSPVLSNASINGRASVFFSNAPSIGGSLALSNRGVAGFMVIRPLVASRGTDQRIFSAAITGQGDWSAASRFLVGVQQNTTQIWYNRYNASIPKTNFNASNNYIISWTYNGAINSLYLNGANADVAQDVAMTDTFGSTLYRLGNQVNVTTETYNGFIGEVIVYDDFLPSAYRQAVEGYLAWKWGIEPDLGTTFSPLTSLPNCAVWFDGADPATFTLSGSNITQWRDKAGSNVTSNIGTPVYVSNAVNGVPGVLLDVNSGFQISPMSNAANRTTLSIYGVVTASSAAQNNSRIFTVGRISDGVTNNDYLASYLWTLYRLANGTPIFEHVSTQLGGTTSDLAFGRPCLVSAIFSGTTLNLWTNGSNRASTNTTNTLIFDRMGIGKNINANAGSSYDSFAGTIGEFLIFYAAHTEAQRLQVESYLASKWNIPTRAPMNLDPTHSYAKTLPFLRDFLPTDISGCALWMDAGDRSTLTLSASNTVTGWTDKSGNRRPLTVNSAGTYSATGFNGLPTIQFVNGQWMTTSTAAVTSNSCSMFIVQQTGASTYLMPLSVGGLTNPYVFWWRGDFNSYTFNQDAVGGMGNNYYTTTGVPMIMTGIVTPNAGNYWAFYMNGNYLYNPNLAGFNTAPLSNTGGSNVYIPGNLVQFGGPGGGGFTGNISEVLIFSNALTNSQRQLVENYLAAKWGLRGYMQGPEAHPFRYGPSVGITPRSTPIGCSLWLDAADTTTLTLSGSNVTAWRDKSGLTTLTLCNTPPTYVSNQVQFNASARFQGAYTMTAPTTVFAVYSTTSTGANEWLIGVNGNEYGSVQGPVPDTAGGYADLGAWTGGGWPAAEFVTTLRAQTGLRMYTVGFNGSNTLVWRNGTAATMRGSPATVTMNATAIAIGAGVGGWAPWAGALSELILFNTPLTTTERQQVEGYLADKWGLSSSLPVGHPYRSGPQTGITPATVPGLRLWLDAADASSYTLSGSNLTAITDKSPFAWALGTPTNFTVNSTKFNTTYPSFFATGTGQLGVNSNFILAQPLTVYFAGQATTANSSTFLFDGTTSDRVVIYQGATMFAGGSEFSPTNSGAATGSHVISAVYNGSSSSMRLNGTTTTGTVGSTGFGGIRISGRNTGGDGYAGHICELLICSGAHTTAQRQQMEGYLAWKWGIPFRLPGGSTNTAALYKTLTSEFDPRSVGGCAVWFDALDSKTIQFATGSNIARWLDKSGLQNHLATNSSNQGYWPVYTQNTLNGKPVVTFSAAGMLGLYAPTSPTQPQTMFVVARPTGLTGNQVLVQCPTLYDQPAGYLGMAVVLPSWTSYTWMYSAFYGENNGVSNALTASTTRTDIIAGSWKPNSMTIAVNGTEYGFSSSTPGALGTKALTNSKMVVGGGWYYPENYYRDFYNGYIAEILIFSNFLSSADRQRIEGWLAWKWGLQSQLPALHPYSNVRF